MKVDRYTKLVLTVIAICLVHMQIRSHLSPSPAQAADTIDVRIVDAYVPLDFNLASVAGYPLVKSRTGMVIGMRGADLSIVPVHWGEVSVSP